MGKAHCIGDEQPWALPVLTHQWHPEMKLQCITTHNWCHKSIQKQCLLFWFCSVWTTETICKVLKANIKDKALCPNSESSEDEDIFHYPCLQVWVNLTASGQEVMLYHTEDTLERNPKVFGAHSILFLLLFNTSDSMGAVRAGRTALQPRSRAQVVVQLSHTDARA